MFFWDTVYKTTFLLLMFRQPLLHFSEGLFTRCCACVPLLCVCAFAWKGHPRNDLYYVRWDVKHYSLTHPQVSRCGRQWTIVDVWKLVGPFVSVHQLVLSWCVPLPWSIDPTCCFLCWSPCRVSVYDMVERNDDKRKKVVL